MKIEEIFQPNTLAFDLFQMVTSRGDFLGNGVSRHVYTFGVDKSLVIKMEEEDNFQNILEWNVWNHVKGTDLAKWFAPVEYISPCGKVLLQKKTKPFRSDNQLPDRIPSFFTDTKLDNWGLLGRQAVCHDYGYHLLLERGMKARTKKACWW